MKEKLVRFGPASEKSDEETSEEESYKSDSLEDMKVGGVVHNLVGGPTMVMTHLADLDDANSEEGHRSLGAAARLNMEQQ